jgi:hypothetical protein
MATTLARSIVSAAAIRAPRLSSSSSLSSVSHGVSSKLTHTSIFRRQQRHATRTFAAAAGDLKELVLKKNEDNGMVVWSKSWCPFCSQAGLLGTFHHDIFCESKHIQKLTTP